MNNDSHNTSMVLGENKKRVIEVTQVVTGIYVLKST